MMEKRNFVTSVRTPAEGADMIDDVLDAGAERFSMRKRAANAMEKAASAEDEKSDAEFCRSKAV